MNTSNTKNYDWLPQVMFLLCVIQPLLDVLSYWLNALGHNNDLTLLLRMAILVATVLCAMLLSEKRRYYWTLLGILRCAEEIPELPADAAFADASVAVGDQTFPALRASNGLVLVPYFAWCHRGDGEMQTWFREK